MITKEQLITAINESNNFYQVAKKFGVDRKIIYKLRKKFQIFDMLCGGIVLNTTVKNNAQKKEINHFVISDMQISEGVDLSHFKAIALEIIERKPDVIIFLGDFWDMKSLWNITKDQFSGKSYKKDIQAGIDAMRLLLKLIDAESEQTGWKPRKVFCLGNHEHRIQKLENNYKSLAGLVGLDDLQLESFGFEVVPFLEPIIIDDIAYCHYFTNGLMNNAMQSTKLLVMRKLMNCVMGHRQEFSIHREVKADGTPIYGIFAGSSYLHDEEYLTAQGNHYARLVWAMNDVKDKNFDPEMLLLSRLMKKWGV
jgi:hypothetical protein